MAQRRNRPAAVDPFVQITSPANRFVPASADSTRNVSGTASLTGGINQVNWTFSPATGQAGVDTSTYPLTTGTATWSVTGATVAADSTQFMVIATGPSLATPTVDYPVGNGVTTVNDSFWNVPLGANLIAPTLAIKTPSTNGSANVSTAPRSLTGSATAPPENRQGHYLTKQSRRPGYCPRNDVVER
ncbi:MAG: hypothetical protein IPP19_16470 [Verrucomicrobia bacterium]|nr:hypothetical protein [Verrucomicrobiota bacterium]